jgi:hypothetical protein
MAKTRNAAAKLGLALLLLAVAGGIGAWKLTHDSGEDVSVNQDTERRARAIQESIRSAPPPQPDPPAPSAQTEEQAQKEASPSAPQPKPSEPDSPKR